MYLWYLIVRPQCISNATTVYPLLASCLMGNSLIGPEMLRARDESKALQRREDLFREVAGKIDKNLSDTF